MKKVFPFIIGTVLASLSHSFAQTPQHPALESKGAAVFRAFVQLPVGFTYASRANAENDDNIHLAGSGRGRAGFHNAAAIELPEQLKQEIKAIAFVTTATDKHGKAFIASRPSLGELGWYTLEQIKVFETQAGLNTVQFEKPLITVAGKVYAVGYEVKSSGESEAALFPLVFVKQESPLKEGCMISIIQGGGAVVHEEGKPIELRQPTQNRGHLAIVVQGDNLASTFDIASEQTPAASIYSQEGRILIDGAFDSFVVFDSAGCLVANSSDTVLPAGSYIVKVYGGSIESVAKVIVK